jgi:hypothetical protein
VDIIKLDLGELERDVVDWIGLPQDGEKWRPSGSIKCPEILEWLLNRWPLQ